MASPKRDADRRKSRFNSALGWLPGIAFLAVALVVAFVVWPRPAVRRNPPRVLRPPPPPPPPRPLDYQPDGLPPENWEPDPKALKISLGKKTWSSQPSALPSAYVLLKSGIGEIRIADLRIGTVRPYQLPKCQRICLSQDGKVIAFTRLRDLFVAHVGGNVTTIAGDSWHYPGTFMAFVASDRVLAGNTLFDLTRRTTIKISPTALQHTGAVTARGRYLALLAWSDERKKWLASMIDLTANEPIGDLEVPVRDASGSEDAVGIAFSRDGRKLCCAMPEILGRSIKAGPAIRLYFFNLESSKLEKSLTVAFKEVSHSVHVSNYSQKLKGLEWCPDGHAVLLNGVAVIDYHLETMIWRLSRPSFGFLAVSRFSSGGHLAVFEAGRDENRIIQMPMPMEKFARLRSTWAIQHIVEGINFSLGIAPTPTCSPQLLATQFVSPIWPRTVKR